MKLGRATGVALFAGALLPAQQDFSRSVAMKQLMLDLIHPASNEILLSVNRGGPQNDSEWAGVRRSALTLAESGDLLMLPGRVREQGDWAKNAKMLSEAGMAAYKAAESKDVKALGAVTDAIDAACTGCHKQYRPNVFPRGDGSK
ncbi:MAG: cytochrome c [Bryobacterales bacterium]|nr:cytochrome c [Bryobacterales bacterium]MBV9397024.1 cytochrome c [Bryobacterales bacterium]